MSRTNCHRTLWWTEFARAASLRQHSTRRMKLPPMWRETPHREIKSSLCRTADLMEFITKFLKDYGSDNGRFSSTGIQPGMRRCSRRDRKQTVPDGDF